MNCRRYILNTLREYTGNRQHLTHCLPKILIVEDDDVSLMVFEQLAKKKGWGVFSARNGRQAIEMVKKENFDLILMDVRMPILNGFQATQAIRGIEANKRTHMPIIAITACALSEDREKCLRAGMDDYLAKPILFPDFYTTVEKWINTNN